MSINYKINKVDQDSYQNNDYVVLENFFDSNIVEELYSTIDNAPEHWWEASSLDYKTHLAYILKLNYQYWRYQLNPYNEGKVYYFFGVC